MPFNIGLPEMMIVLALALIVLGPKRLPDFGRSLGSSMREFKDSITGSGGDDADERREVRGDAAGDPAATS